MFMPAVEIGPLLYLLLEFFSRLHSWSMVFADEFVLFSATWNLGYMTLGEAAVSFSVPFISYQAWAVWRLASAYLIRLRITANYQLSLARTHEFVAEQVSTSSFTNRTGILIDLNIWSAYFNWLVNSGPTSFLRV
ncbi:hypothetical protein C8J56DRAFT_891972 [Mycena floridula]|nr:hypothetical protein C8J56DRAFT_891972 [Mycena floridula]